MNIPKNKKLLLLRFSNYKRFNFVSEHLRIIDEKNSVWMLKTGKQIPNERLVELFSEPNVLLLKAPKKAGGEYYIATVKEAFNGQPQKEMDYPAYYNELVEDSAMWAIDSLEGTWFCFSKIEKLPDDYIPCLRLVSNHKQVEEVLSGTMSAVVYVYSDQDVQLE